MRSWSHVPSGSSRVEHPAGQPIGLLFRVITACTTHPRSGPGPEACILSLPDSLRIAAEDARLIVTFASPVVAAICIFLTVERQVLATITARFLLTAMPHCLFSLSFVYNRRGVASRRSPTPSSAGYSDAADDDVAGHVADDRSNDGAAEAAAAGVLGAKYLLTSPLNRCALYAVQTHLHSPITQPARTRFS